MIYEKDGIRKKSTSSIVVGDKVIFHPSHEQWEANGWTEFVLPTPQVVELSVKERREQEYEMRSDALFIASEKYKALGQTEKYEEMRALWLAEVEKIGLEYPYLTEE